MQFTFTHEDLALVLFGRRVDGGDHGRGVGDQDGVHETPGHHADHDDPHLHIIWSMTNDNRGGKKFFFSLLFVYFAMVTTEVGAISLVGASMDP